ncbi:hypothetical protein [Desulfobacterium sp. N47]|uniref:Zinc finger/thioredoxin putative domain-containing protein n=1 Tax=uncultured Desulfobacterium sp. TaxID=201089 RepID=E1YDY3_9BACT|nr:hypothetical protein N47_L13750 [uncultured Desulfobacterium sp.]
MKINCLSCGHNLDLDEDTYSDYEGQVKCYACNALLEINLKEGRIKSVNISKQKSYATAEA